MQRLMYYMPTGRMRPHADLRRATAPNRKAVTAGRRFGVVAVVMLLALVAQRAGAFSPDELPGLPEHQEVRRRTRHLLFAPVEELLRVEPRVYSQRADAHQVQVRSVSQRGYAYLLYLNEVDGTFPVYGQGSMIIRRSLEDGSFDQVKVFLRNDERFYVRIRPLKNDRNQRLSMTVYVMNRPLNRDVILPFGMEVLLTAPIADVLQLTKANVQWQSILAAENPESYRSVRLMAERTRDALPSLPDADDGAMDRNGNLVYIESLKMQNGLPGFNCSGFAKWVCDGLYYPITGTYMDIDALKVKHLDLRGHRFSRPLEEERDPYFGLDWSRNIATTLLRLSGGADDPESADVRDVPGFRYLEDVGYQVEDLATVLFQLALLEPGHFYIGSINRDFGSAPVLRQHVHIVVFFPYFREDGRFVVDVMERNVETSVESLYRRYAGDFVHLVRVAADGRYEPPKIEY